MTRGRLALPIVIAAALAGGARAGEPERIVGGAPAQLDEFPSAVLIGVTVGQGAFNCSGTLIAPTWVVTAGHCVSPSEFGATSQAELTAGTRVYFDTVDIHTNVGVAVSALDTIPDPLFAIGGGGIYDLGLIELATPVTDVQPARVDFDPALAPVGAPLTIVGFGMSQLGIEYALDDQSISCTPFGFYDTDHVCISELGTSGIGPGDSGGPWFTRVRGHLLEAGVSSLISSSNGLTGVSTRIAAEADFLLANIPSLACAQDSDCPVEMQCGSRTCVARSCTQGSDCPATTTCFDGGCIVAPFSPTGLGSACTRSADCDSGRCGAGPSGAMTCVDTCTVGADDACPSGLECVAQTGAQAGAGACWPAPPGGGCDASRSHPPIVLGLALVALLRRAPRRRRRSTPA